MITFAEANSLTDRAKAAYYRNGKKEIDGWVRRGPDRVETVEHDGLFYIRLSNVNGILAVYRVRSVGGELVLKGLKRWPKALEEI